MLSYVHYRKPSPPPEPGSRGKSGRSAGVNRDGFCPDLPLRLLPFFEHGAASSVLPSRFTPAAAAISLSTVLKENPLSIVLKENPMEMLFYIELIFNQWESAF